MKRSWLAKSVLVVIGLQLLLPQGGSAQSADSSAENLKQQEALAHRRDLPSGYVQDGKLYVPYKTKVTDPKTGVVTEQEATLVTDLGTEAEVRQNMPSIMAERSRTGKLLETAYNFTSQYIFFQAATGLVAMSGLAMDYASDPLARNKFEKAFLTSESMASFGGFMAFDWGMKGVLQKIWKKPIALKNALIPNIGMAAGMLGSTFIGEIWHDKDFQACGKSGGTDLKSCDAAFQNWVVTNKIVEYAPIIIQLGMSAPMAAGVGKAISGAAHSVKNLITGSKAAALSADEIAASRAQALSEGIVIRLSKFGITQATAEWLGANTAKTVVTGIASINGLVIFLATDAILPSPAMKWAMRTFYDEKIDLAGDLEKIPLFGQFADVGSFIKMAKLRWDFNVVANDSAVASNQKAIEKARATHTAVPALEKQDPTIPLIGGFIPFPLDISKSVVDTRYVDLPQDDFRIVKEAHAALISALDFAARDGWQPRNFAYCSPKLSDKKQLTYEEAKQFYVGLTAQEKQCLINTEVLDNLTTYINLNSKHRTSLLQEMTQAANDWIEALSKFIDMETVSVNVYQHFIHSKFALDHGQTSYTLTYKSRVKDQPDKQVDFPAFPMTYEGVEALVTKYLSDTKSLHERECETGNTDCEESNSNAAYKFLPDSVGKAKIRNITDYIITEMACGPDVNDTSSFWDRAVSAQSFVTGFGKLSYVQNGWEAILRKVHFRDQKVPFYTQTFEDPNSAMIYMNIGDFAHFVPPRITADDGSLCSRPLEGDDANNVAMAALKQMGRADWVVQEGSVEKGMWKENSPWYSVASAKKYHGIFDYVVTHLNPALLNNATDPTAPSIEDWLKQNIVPKFNTALTAFQGLFNRELGLHLFPTLTSTEITSGCGDAACMNDWRSHKVSLGVYQSMEIELTTLFGVINEIYEHPVAPTAESLAARAADKADALAEAQKESDANAIAQLTAPAQTADVEKLKDLEQKFLQEFAKNDENGLQSFKNEQARKAAIAFNMFFWSSRANDINDLQSDVAQKICDELVALLQERISYSGYVEVNKLVRQQDTRPVTSHKDDKPAESANGSPQE